MYLVAVQKRAVLKVETMRLLPTDKDVQAYLAELNKASFTAWSPHFPEYPGDVARGNFRVYELFPDRKPKNVSRKFQRGAA